MSLNVVANSMALLVSGVMTVVGGVVAAIWIQAFWPLVLVPVGLVMAFRLERDAASTAQAALIQRGALIHKVEKEFYGWFGRQLVHGPYDRKHLAAAAELLDEAAETLSEPAHMVATSMGPKSGLIRVWPLKSIQSIAFTTGEKTFTLHTDEAESVHGFKAPSYRDEVLKFIKPRAAWRVTEEFRTIFKLNILAIIVSLLLMFFTMALAFTAIGIVQPNQLPLATWADLKNVRGKAGGVMFVWVCLCEAYLYLVNLNLPPALMFIVGVLASFVLGALMYRGQWTKVTDRTWHNSMYSVVNG